MTTTADLWSRIRAKGTYLCVGLDPDMDKLPAAARAAADPLFEFNRAIIDATAAHAVAYKPNIAFYECYGSAGWESLRRTVEHIRRRHPGMLVIADAKRGDIGNTSERYAKTFYDTYGFDAVTVAPYMGEDSVRPFLGRPGKWAVVLGVTSNRGSADFQRRRLDDGDPLYAHVLRRCAQWGTPEDTMFVAGGTDASMVAAVRRELPAHFLLIPGVGAQGGDLEQVSRAGMNDRCGLLVNSSRGIIYASQGDDYAQAAGREAAALAAQMRHLLER